MASPDVGGFPFIPALIRLKTHSYNLKIKVEGRESDNLGSGDEPLQREK